MNRGKYQDFIAAGAPELPKNYYYKVSKRIDDPSSRFGMCVWIMRKRCFGLIRYGVAGQQARYWKSFESYKEITLEDLVLLANKAYKIMPKDYNDQSMDYWVGRMG